MATCPSCTLEISDAATRCPHCTSPIRSQREQAAISLGKVLVAVIVFIIVAAVGVAMLEGLNGL